jgi:tetratricopeptide (TPR) repeat protein
MNQQPETAEAYNNRGLAKRAIGDLDGALNDFDRAIEVKPNLWQAYSNRSLVKKAKGDLVGAQADSDKALELKPDSPDVCYSRGMRRMSKSDWTGAVAHFNRAIELNPSFAEAYGNRGAAKNASGDVDDALLDFQKAIELKPDLPGIKEMMRLISKKAKRRSKGADGVNKKKIPTTENTLALRTDFSDESAWKSLCASIQDSDEEFQAHVDFISDSAFDGLTARQLPSFLSDDSKSFAFIIDKVALSNPEHPILAVDLQGEPGRTFRVIPSALWAVENNLSIANMGFEEFADAADKGGIFRGFQGR